MHSAYDRGLSRQKHSSTYACAIFYNCHIFMLLLERIYSSYTTGSSVDRVRTFFPKDILLL